MCICGADQLNGFTCNNPRVPNVNFPLSSLCFGVGVVHNINYWAFVGCEGPLSLTLNFDPASCEDGQGIQAGVFEGDCSGSNIWDCNASCNTSTFTLSGIVEPCQVYYFWVDGCNGDVCTYTISVSGNTGCRGFLPRPVPPINVSDERPSVCDEITLSWLDDRCMASVYWYRNGTRLKQFPTSYHYIEILDTIPFEICASIIVGTEDYFCDSAYKCVTINPQVRVDSGTCSVLCENQLPYLWHDQVITESCINPPCTAQVKGKNDCLYDSIKSFYVVETGEIQTIDTIICGQGTYKDGAGKVWKTGICQEYISWSIEKSHPDCENTVLCDTGYYLNLSFLKIDVDREKSCSACSGELEVCFDIDYNLDCFLTPLDRNNFEFVIVERNSADSIFFNELNKCVPIDSVGGYRLLARHKDLKKCGWELVHFFSVNDRDFRDPEIRLESNSFCKSDTIDIQVFFDEVLCSINWWIDSDNASIIDHYSQKEIEIVPDHLNIDSIVICYSALTDCMTLDSLCQTVYLIDPMDEYLHIISDSICGDSATILSSIFLNDLQWRQISGPGQLDFERINHYELKSQCDLVGSYQIEFKSILDECIKPDTLTMIFMDMPIAIAEVQQEPCAYEFLFKAIDTINHSDWSIIEKPLGENVIISDSSNSMISGHVTGPGKYRIRYYLANALCEDSVDYCIDFTGPPENIKHKDVTLTCERQQFSKPLGNLSRWRHELDNNWSVGDSIEDQRVGEYYIETFNSDSSCSELDTFFVYNDAEKPDFELTVVPSINCDSAFMEIRVLPKNFEIDEVDINWLVHGANVVNWKNQSRVLIDFSGLVEIQIFSKRNHCSHREEVLVNIPKPLFDVYYSLINPECDGKKGSIEIDSILGGFSPFAIFLNSKLIDKNKVKRLSAGIHELKVVDSLGCEWKQSIPMEALGDIDIGLIDDFEIPYQSSLRLDSLVDKNYSLYPMEYDSIHWINAQTSRIITKKSGFRISEIKEPLLLLLRVFRNGCIAEDIIQIRVRIKKRVWMPNVITPDADNGNVVNKYLSIHIQKERVRYIEFLRVYDRWGELIYQQENIPYSEELGSSTEGWDGTLNGVKMNPGVFVYHARVHFITNEVEELVGDVTLLR